MNPDVPYMKSVTNLHKILDAIQNAGKPDSFTLEFLKDLSFASSNDRGVVKVLKFIGLLDDGNRPQSSYSEFMDHTKAKRVLAKRLREAYDDLFISDKRANEKQSTALKGWFKTKTGAGDAVAEKMATTFRSLAQYADFSVKSEQAQQRKDSAPETPTEGEAITVHTQPTEKQQFSEGHRRFGLVYRFEIHLPDTQNIDTYRAIFKALREELM